MAILGADSSDTDNVGDGAPGELGQDPKTPAKGSPGQDKPNDRESQTPEVPKEDLPRPRSTFGKWPPRAKGLGGTIGPSKAKVGYPCLHCPHTHRDHSYYEPRHCLIDECGCSGLLIDHKLIPSKEGD